MASWVAWRCFVWDISARYRVCTSHMKTRIWIASKQSCRQIDGTPELFLATNSSDRNSVHIPEGMNPLIPTKLLVQTGPGYLDTGCTSPGTVEVHLIPSGESFLGHKQRSFFSLHIGAYGTPRSGTLANNLILLTLRSDGILKTYKGLNMLYLMKTMLEYCTITSLAWEPRKDILFLCQHYGEQVQSIRSQLDENLILNAFLRSPFFTRLSFGDQRRCYQTLRAQDPPLLVAQVPSAGQSDLPRPRVASYTGQPATSATGPPPAQKAISSQKHATYHSSQPLGPVMASMMPPNMPNLTKDSRNRYRRVSTQGKEGQPGHIPQPRSISMQYRQQQQNPVPSNNSQHLSPQTMADSRSSQCAPVMSPLANHTMRASSAGHPGYLASRISAQAGPVTNSFSTQQSQRQYQTPSSQSPDTTFSHSQREQHIQAQQRQSSGSAPKQPPFQSRPTHQSTQQTQPQSSRKPVPDTKSTAPNQPCPKPDSRRKDSGSSLQLVGPEGLWVSSLPSHHFPLPPTTADSTPATILEPSTNNPPRLPRQSSSTILAELSANIDDAIKTATTPPLSHSPTLEPGYKHAKSGSVELPASLTIRFSTLSSCSTATSTTSSLEKTKNLATATATQPLPILQTNATRYSQIFPAPPTAAAVADTTRAPVVSPTPPLTPAPLSIYKAYQPPAKTTTWETLPASPPVSPPVQDAWIDVAELAREYQMELPGFEEGYGSV